MLKFVESIFHVPKRGLILFLLFFSLASLVDWIMVEKSGWESVLQREVEENLISDVIFISFRRSPLPDFRYCAQSTMIHILIFFSIYFLSSLLVNGFLAGVDAMTLLLLSTARGRNFFHSLFKGDYSNTSLLC